MAQVETYVHADHDMSTNDDYGIAILPYPVHHWTLTNRLSISLREWRFCVRC